MKKIARNGGNVEDVSVSPILRQTCACLFLSYVLSGSLDCSVLHWGYQLTDADYRAYL